MRNVLVLSGFFIIYLFSKSVLLGQVLGSATSRVNEDSSQVDYLTQETTLSAKTSFDQDIYDEVEEIPFETEYKDDPEVEYGEEEILAEGVLGTKTTSYLITSWLGEEIDRTVAEVKIVKPTTQVISRGTKVVWREIDTDIGNIKYWRKLLVWATKYDGNCDGCRGLTYSGTLVRKGVCAVDPKVISLGTNFYVEGYGMCRSEDIGGGIKGNEVDLGYEDVSKGEWRTGFTNVYLMTSYPEN